MKAKISLIPVFLLAVVGCGRESGAYSSSVVYEVRTSPLVLSTKLGEEHYYPDPPGQLPLYKPAGVLDPRNPLSEKGMELFEEGVLRDPMKMTRSERGLMRAVLDDLFGSPRSPRVELLSVPPQGVVEDISFVVPPKMQATADEAAKLNREIETVLKLDRQRLKEGSRLYRLHCLHCHGVTGNGRGPTAQWVNPHPRDYRKGLFKFQSVDQTERSPRKPRREDLHRIIKLGVEGTSMPAHNLLSDAQIDDLVSYVIHLSIRGEAEYSTMALALEEADDGSLVSKFSTADGFSQSPPLDYFVQGKALEVAKSWLDSQKPSAEIEPVPYPEAYKTFDGLKRSVLRGQALFNADKSALNDSKLFDPDEVKGRLKKLEGAACKQCHVDYGRRATYKWDEWGTLVRARNFTTGIFRGGRRPVDLYYRIHSGINGSGMLIQGNNLKGEEIWDLVNFVRVLPYPDMRKRFGIKLSE